MDNLPKPTCSVLETEVNNDLSRKFEFISDRYVLRNEENSEELDYMPLEYDFSVLDLYNNKLVQFGLPKFYNCCESFYSLGERHGIVVEGCGGYHPYYISLIEIDFKNRIFHKLGFYKIDCDYLEVHVDNHNPLKFTLFYMMEETQNTVEHCELIENSIKFGTKIDIEDFESEHHFENQLYFSNLHLQNPAIWIYNLEKHSQTEIALDPLPDEVYKPTGWPPRTWIRGCVFICVVSKATGENKIAFADPRIRKWKMLDFSTKLNIRQIHHVYDGNLLIYADNEKSAKFYKLSIRKPFLLSHLSWFGLIQYIKRIKPFVNPHETATRLFLPKNSEIQSPFAEEDKN